MALGRSTGGSSLKQRPSRLTLTIREEEFRGRGVTYLLEGADCESRYVRAYMLIVQINSLT